MGSKVIVFLILFLATVLLVSSEGVASTKVAAETSNNINPSNKTIGNHVGEGGELSGYEGGEHGGYEHKGGEHGGYEGGEGHGERRKREEPRGGYEGGERHGKKGKREEPRRGSYGRKRGRYCHYGCCGKSYRPCRRCCTFAGEKPEADEP